MSDADLHNRRVFGLVNHITAIQIHENALQQVLNEHKRIYSVIQYNTYHGMREVDPEPLEHRQERFVCVFSSTNSSVSQLENIKYSCALLTLSEFLPKNASAWRILVRDDERVLLHRGIYKLSRRPGKDEREGMSFSLSCYGRNGLCYLVCRITVFFDAFFVESVHDTAVQFTPEIFKQVIRKFG